MTIFDLVFIVVFLASVMALVISVTGFLLGRYKQSHALLITTGACLAVYLGVLLAVSLASPQRVLLLGEDRCFDDWCIAITAVSRVQEFGQGEQAIRANGIFYVIFLRLSNASRGRDQRASSAAVYLIDDHKRMYTLSPLGQQGYETQFGPALPLTTRIPAGQQIETVEVFDLPEDSHNVSLIIKHPVGFSPGLFVIGDDSSLLHKPTIIRTWP